MHVKITIINFGMVKNIHGVIAMQTHSFVKKCSLAETMRKISTTLVSLSGSNNEISFMEI